MTAGEIVTSFRQAANPKAQVKVLAQLNGCGTGKIEKILRDYGQNVPVVPSGWKWTAREAERLRQLAEQGKTAGEISDLMHRSRRSVASKAKHIGLKLALEVEKNHVRT